MTETIRDHLDHLTRAGARPGTIDQRRWALMRLHRWIDGHVLEARIDELRAFTGRPDRAESARANEVSHLKMFYEWAVREEILDRDPTIRLERPSVPRGAPRPMPKAAVAWALAHAPADRVRPFLILAAYGGLRACEVARVRGDDVDGGWLWIPVQKGGDSDQIRLSPPLARLARVMPGSGWWFPREDGAPGPTSAGRVSRLANRWLHDHGIAHTFHSLRHFYGTELRRRGGMLVAKRGLRHKSIQSTEIYTALDDDELATAADGIVDLTDAA
jgi:integrase